MTRYADMKHPPEAIRLHLDWWGKCRTCSFWEGDRTQVKNPAWCGNALSALFRSDVHAEGHCKEWDTYDIEAAVALLDNEEEHTR